MRSLFRLFCVHLTLFLVSESEAFPLACTGHLLDSSDAVSVLCRREVYRILQEEGIDLPRYAVLNRDPDRPEGQCPSSAESHFHILDYFKIFCREQVLIISLKRPDSQVCCFLWTKIQTANLADWPGLKDFSSAPGCLTLS